MQYSPIVLFAYNRLAHIRRTIDALKNNYLAEESALFIFSDASKNNNEQNKVLNVREYLKTVSGFKKVTIIERGYNFGLSQSIISGVNEIIAQYGRAIILEDDLVTSPYFLKFMNDGLLMYQNEEQVISICGYMYPSIKKYEDVLFLRVADCWGWATWKRGWDLFVSDGKLLYNVLKERKLFRKFNLDGAYNYTKMLKLQIYGQNDSWAVRWYASAFLNGKLSLYPWKSLVVNIGFDGSGRHKGAIDYFKTELLNKPVPVKIIPFIENKHVVKKIEFYLKKQWFKIICKTLASFLKQWCNKIYQRN